MFVPFDPSLYRFTIRQLGKTTVFSKFTYIVLMISSKIIFNVLFINANTYLFGSGINAVSMVRVVGRQLSVYGVSTLSQPSTSVLSSPKLHSVSPHPVNLLILYAIYLNTITLQRLAVSSIK